MFRTATRLGFRVAATTQARMASSQSAPNAARMNPKLALFVGGSVLAVTFSIQNAKPAQNFWGSPASVTFDLKKAKDDIKKLIEADDAKRADGTSIAPTLIRLAWHASGTYSIFDKTGGSNGAGMRFAPESEWGANAGLKIARDFVEKIAKNHGLTIADAWTLAGAVAVEFMNGPVIPWRQGRTDYDAAQNTAKTLPDGRLPNANMGCPVATNSHIRDIFGRMGFNDREIVALIGAHSTGRCHENASGFWGPWTRSEITFSNDFFNMLLNEKWTVKKTHNGKPWTGPHQYENADGTLMMLPTDLWLLQDKEFRKYVELYAKDEGQFFKDFAAAFSKLLELGVQFPAK